MVVDYPRSAGVGFVFRPLEVQCFRGSWQIYVWCSGMCNDYVTRSICIVLPISDFYRAQVRPMAGEWIYQHYPTWKSLVSVLPLSPIQMVGSCVSHRLVEMFILRAFADDVAAAVGVICRPA